MKLIRIASKMKKYLAKCASKVSVWGCTLSHRIMIIINCCFFFYKHLSFSSLLPCKASRCLSRAAPQRFSAQVYLLIYDNCDKCRDLVHGGNYAFLSGYTKIIFLLISQLLTKINFAMKKKEVLRSHALFCWPKLTFETSDVSQCRRTHTRDVSAGWKWEKYGLKKAWDIWLVRQQLRAPRSHWY